MAYTLNTRVLVGLVVVVIIGSALIPVVSSFVEGAQTYTRTTYQTLNIDFSDNADGWDNYVENNAVNAWNASGYITTTVTDVEDLYENGIWYQALEIPSISDGIVSATLSFDWRLVDNDNISAINFAVYLDDGTENTLIWDDTSVENTITWNSQENNVASIADVAGTYTVYIRAEIKPDSGEAASNIIAGWDDVSLKVVIQTKNITTTSIITYLIPLFFVVGLVLIVVYRVASKHEGSR